MKEKSFHCLKQLLNVSEVHMISCSRSYLALVQREGVVVLDQVRPWALILLKLLEY